jgi:hypothetical protein
MKSAVASNDAANHPIAKAASIAASETDSVKAKRTGTAKPGSHSALFGLGPKEEPEEEGATVHPPKGSGEVSGTIDEADEMPNEQAKTEKNNTNDDDTGGYLGLKKAAMEEEEKRKNGASTNSPSWTATMATKTEADDDRNPSTFPQTTTQSNTSQAAPFPPIPSANYWLANLAPGSPEKKNSLGREISPGEMPDGTHRRSIAEGMPSGHHFGRKNTASNGGEKSGGFRDRLKDKFRSKNK